MKLTPAQLKAFDEEGYLFLPDCFSDEEVARHHLEPHDPASHRHLSLGDLLENPPDKAADPAIS